MRIINHPIIMKTYLLCILGIAIQISAFAASETNQDFTWQRFLDEAMQKFTSRVDELNKDFGKKRDDLQKDADKKTDDAKKKEKGSDVAFEGRTEMSRFDFVMSVPEVQMDIQEISYDVPVIEFKRQGVKLTVPVLVMREREGPPIPHSTLEWRNDGIFGTPSPTWKTEWKRSVVSWPEMENRLQEYSLDVPSTVRMERQSIKLQVPRITMRDKKMAFDHPVFIIDKVKIGNLPIYDKKRKEVEDISKEYEAKTESLGKELEAAIKRETVALYPNIFAATMGLAAQPFEEQIRKYQDDETDLLSKQRELAEKKVAPQDPSRRAIEQQLLNVQFFKNSLCLSEGGAVFDGYSKLMTEVLSELEAKKISRDDFAVQMSKWGYPVPAPSEAIQPPTIDCTPSRLSSRR